MYNKQRDGNGNRKLKLGFLGNDLRTHIGACVLMHDAYMCKVVQKP